MCAALDADGVPPPGTAKKWQRRFARDCAFDDAYAPHTVEELKALGVWWYNRRETRVVPVSLGGGSYRKGKRVREKPRREWIPVPASGVSREDLWGLSGGLLRCPDCGRSSRSPRGKAIRARTGEELQKADGNKRRAVYNTLGVTVWAAEAKQGPIRVEMSALGGEEVCRSDATSTR